VSDMGFCVQRVVWPVNRKARELARRLEASPKTKFPDDANEFHRQYGSIFGDFCVNPIVLRNV